MKLKKKIGKIPQWKSGFNPVNTCNHWNKVSLKLKRYAISSFLMTLVFFFHSILSNLPSHLNIEFEAGTFEMMWEINFIPCGSYITKDRKIMEDIFGFKKLKKIFTLDLIFVSFDLFLRIKNISIFQMGLLKFRY